MKHKRKKWW